MIGLSPLSAGHRRRFQPTCVRPSTGSYPRFSLPTDSSPGFASAACDSNRPVQARFRCGSVSLNLAACRDSQAHSTKGTRSPSSERLPLLGGARFQALFHSPLGVLFTFPSRYWFAIGHRRVFSLGGWSPLLRTGFHVSGPTRDPPSQAVRAFAYGAVTLFRAPFQASSASPPLCNWPRGLGAPGYGGPTTPRAATPPGFTACTGLGSSPLSLAATRGISFDFSSSGYLDVSVPPVPFHTLWIGVWILEVCSSGFPHSDISGSMDICSSPKLFAAYHVFHRLLVPRHPPCALFSLT